MLATDAFSSEAWQRNATLYAAIRDMRFNLDLKTGTLDADRFRHYVVQDAHYLIGFGQALAVAAAKADDPRLLEQLSRAATEAVVVERSLHTDYFRLFDIDEAIVAATPMTPVCHHYVSFLIASGFREPLAVHAAALLPCFWVYRDVGQHILASAASPNPYQAWIDTYAGDEFSTAVDAMIAATDRLAERAGPALRPAMHLAFTRAMQLEWMFWDSADRLAAWPV